jgi:hypothetical protein
MAQDQLSSDLARLTGGIRLVRFALEERRMQKAAGLTRLMGLLQGTDSNAGSLADRLEKAHGELQTEMAATTTIVETVEKTRDQLKAVNQAMLGGDNGGPAGPLAGSSAISNGSGFPPVVFTDPTRPVPPVVPPWQAMDSAPRDGTMIMLRLPGVADDGMLGRWGGSQWFVGATNDAVFPSMWKARWS